MAGRVSANGMDWDRLGRFYDWQLWLERGPLAAAVELAEIRPHDHLLDVATGTGGLLRLLAGGPQRPGRAVGLDASRAMLARTRGLPGGWELVIGDAGAMPFENDAFDVAACAYLLHLLERPARLGILAECRRVLRPGGRLVTVTVGRPETPFRKAAALPFTMLRELMPRRFQALRPVDPRPDLHAAGFAVERSRFVSFGYPSLCVLARTAA